MPSEEELKAVIRDYFEHGRVYMPKAAKDYWDGLSDEEKEQVMTGFRCETCAKATQVIMNNYQIFTKSTGGLQSKAMEFDCPGCGSHVIVKPVLGDELSINKEAQ